MHKSADYIKIIEEHENESTKNLIGKINVESLKNIDGNDLLYIFPLVERMVIEIYKLIPGAIVENNEQGIMKTITQIIKDNEKNKTDVIPKELKELINFYFEGDKALRNLLFHVNEESITVEYNKVEIQCIVASLLKILNMQITKYDIKCLKSIEKL